MFDLAQLSDVTLEVLVWRQVPYLHHISGLGDHDCEGAGRHAGHHAGRNVDVVLAGTCQMTSPVTQQPQLTQRI